MTPVAIALGLAQIAPVLLRFFGVGEKPAAVVEQVVSIAQKVTGAASPEDALAQLQADAEKAHQFRMAVLEADTGLEQAYLADRANARNRDVEFLRAGRRNVRADIMVLCAVLGLIACLVALVGFRAGLPGEAVGIISTVAGIFGACLRDAFQFEFGSSRGSREKDALLSDLSRTGGA